MEKKKSSQAIEEVTSEDKDTYVVVPKGEIVQLTYALQYSNIYC